MKRLLILMMLSLMPLFSEAQSWRFVRHEVSFGVGVSNFLGDLGGAKGIGTHYFKDLKGRSTRPSLIAGYKYMFTPNISGKVTALWGYLHGDDAVTKNLVRQNRNLSFRSMIGEFNLIAEIYPWGERVSPRYKLTGVRSIHGNEAFTIMPYFTTGIGMTLFNPKAQLNGQWYALQPLHTEGQGLPGRPDPYKKITMNIPFGIGAKYLIDKKWSLTFDLTVRYTLSDYIDDVSTTYYDPVKIEAATGTEAAILSNRALDPLDGNYGVSNYTNGLVEYKQRGNPRFNDAYMFAIISVNYRFSQGATFIPKF
ncbi:MAG: DUF6089 family protein [Crocinitomicaceae bacterium]